MNKKIFSAFAICLLLIFALPSAFGSDASDIYPLPPDEPIEMNTPGSGESPYIIPDTPDLREPTPPLEPVDENTTPIVPPLEPTPAEFENITPTPENVAPTDFEIIDPTSEPAPPENVTPTPPEIENITPTPDPLAWYAIEFWVSEEGYLSPAPLTVQGGESVRMPELSPVVAPSGKRFVGWSANMNAIVPDYRPGENITPARNLFLYAVFAPESYEIIYQIDMNEIRETVPTGSVPQQIPILPEGFYSWLDENGNFINPAVTEIWNVRVFTASNMRPVPEITPPALKSGDEHEAFMSGFEDGLFHPGRSLTRAQTAKILYGLLADPIEELADFTDVPEDAWYAAPVRVLGAMGIVTPDENGAFRGNDAITRAEFAAILAAFVPVSENPLSFPDVPSDRPDAAAIGNTAAAGLFGGNEEGLFMPDGILTRAQAAVVFNRLLGRNANTDAIHAAARLRIFPDVPRSFWAYDQIMEASTSHVGFVDSETGLESWMSANPDPVPLADGFYNINSRLYHVLDGQFLYSTSDSQGYVYNADGQSTTGNDELDEFLANIIAKWTNDDMTRNQKIRALYNYVRDYYTYLARDHVAKGSTGWEPAYALAFFQRGKGNCYSFSSAFYLLVRQLGLEAQTVMGDIGPVNHRPHCWVRIKLDGSWRLFDPELEMSYRRRGITSYNLYNFTYATSPFQYFVW